jgi:hypothetical protein
MVSIVKDMNRVESQSFFSFFSYFIFLISIYSLYRGNSLWQLWINSLILYSGGGYITPQLPPLCKPLLPHLKQLQETELLYIVYVYETHQLYSLTFISLIYPSPPKSTPTHTIPILQSCLSLLISKVLKGFLRVSPLLVYFGQFNPLQSQSFDSVQSHWDWCTQG